MESLEVKRRDTGTVNFNDSTGYFPFRVGMAADEILELWGLLFTFDVPATDTAFNVRFALLQKDETEQTGITVPAIVIRAGDHDILLRGNMRFTTEAGPDRDDSGFRQVWFPKPILVPRSPSLEVYSSLNANINCYADLYYVKKKASVQTIMQLMKKWKGRKQDVVSNAPRVIDE